MWFAQTTTCHLISGLLILGSLGVHPFEQPREFASSLLRLHRPLQLLLMPLNATAEVTPSSVRVQEKYAVPSTQGWSRCQHCGLREDGKVVIFGNQTAPHSAGSEVMLAWSLWGEFFHKYNNDRIKGVHDANYTGKYTINRPVFVLPLITLHVGHILIDLLEQLYQTHMLHYGKIRTDCVIILDVASEAERAVLREKVYHSINVDDSSVGTVLKRFTDLPVYSIDLWKELGDYNNIVFSDLHLGLDISLTHYNTGQHSQPCFISLPHGNTANIDLAKRYRKFASYLNQPSDGESIVLKHNNAKPRPQILIVQRKKNRVILNMKEVLQTTELTGLVTELGDLDAVGFQEQRQLFTHIDVLVSVAGTALHNVLFMRPGSAVVMFMQPHWCEYAWMYANQAILLGVQPFVYCTPATSPLERDSISLHANASTTRSKSAKEELQLAQWSRQLWLQGPRHYKSDNITVDISEYATLINQAVAHVRKSKSKNEGPQVGGLEHTENAVRSLHPLNCPSASEHRVLERTSDNKPSAARSGLLSETGDKSRPAKHTHRVLEVYFSSVTAEFLPAERSWKVGIVGEIGTAAAEFSALLESLPYLSICMESTDMAPWCHPVAAFNYYTDLILNMEAPVQALHFWAQASTSGGKLRHSDMYVVLDCHLPEAGFAIHNEVVGSEVSFEVNVREQCTMPEGHTQQQVLAYPTAKFGAPKSLCRSSKRLLFRHTIDSRLSLQRSTADFCWAHDLSAANCVDFIAHLQAYLLRAQTATTRGLPAVQHEPSPANPFHFLHIEKTAGSTLREYISAAVDERGLFAFIPCHTEHCAVFAVPVHRPNTSASTDGSRVIPGGSAGATLVDGTTSASTATDWENLDDLRLIQPPGRDNSNLSVLAGHFDFYAPYRALPQCQQPRAADLSMPARTFSSDSSARWSKHVLTAVNPSSPTVPDPPLPSPACRVSCLTIGRHPVDRAISYYYQRFYQHPSKVQSSAGAAPGEVPLNQRMINELTPAELEMVALSTREGMHSHFYPEVQVFIDEGMADAACSALLGLKYTSGRPVGPISISPELPAALYPTVRANLYQCVVGLQEQWNQTLQVLDHWFPWLDFSKNPDRKKMSIYSGLETRITLRKDLYDVLVALNPCDMMLYEEMQRIFASQIEVLQLDPYK